MRRNAGGKHHPVMTSFQRHRGTLKPGIGTHILVFKSGKTM